MKNEYTCFCGLYCLNCAVKAKIEPTAKLLHTEMKKAGFEDIIHLIDDGEGFWRFLKSVSEKGACISCRAGSGNPGCTVRLCAKEKEIEMCGLCESYPCKKFDELFKTYPILKIDNNILQIKGIDEWIIMQNKRNADGFTYTD